MLHTIVLICALGTAPQDCSPNTAIDVLRVSPAKNTTMCGFFGQATIAPTAIKPEPGKSYEKIMCERVTTTER